MLFHWYTRASCALAAMLASDMSNSSVITCLLSHRLSRRSSSKLLLRNLAPATKETRYNILLNKFFTSMQSAYCTLNSNRLDDPRYHNGVVSRNKSDQFCCEFVVVQCSSTYTVCTPLNESWGCQMKFVYFIIEYKYNVYAYIIYNRSIYIK